MADYSKLKVSELKEELKARGISLTGLKLKQNFVDKLVEADASGQTNTSGAVIAPAGVAEDTGTNEQDSTKEAQDVESRDEEAHNADVNSTQSVTRGSIAKNENDLVFPGSANGVTKFGGDGAAAQLQGPVHNTLEESTEHPLSGDGTSQEPMREEPMPTTPEVDERSQPATIPTVDAPGSQVEKSQSLETPSPSAILAPSSATSTPTSIQVPVKELIEDSKKRKRRSVTPPPSAADIAQKRAKASDGSPRMTKPVDTTTDSEDVVAPEVAQELDSKEPRSEPSALDKMQAATDAREIMREGDGLPQGEQSEILGATSTKPAKDDEIGNPMSEPLMESAQSPEKQSVRTAPGGSLFASLKKFDSNLSQEPPGNKPPGAGGVSDQSALPDQDPEERAVTPALHPATSSLYIRNFKRPLHLPTLRAHVAKIAQAPSSSNTAEDPISSYFRDSIRGHALISFTSISAASRVRSALHDTRYPDEKTREPLWIDFVPDDKVHSWIDVETNSGGRGAAQRWEVVYEEGPRGMEAILQEVGAGAGPRRQSTLPQRQPSMSEAQRQPSMSDVQRALPTTGVHPDRLPLVPQVRTDATNVSQDHRRDSQPETSGTGFRALDELFQSTTVKPKLYYKPVSQRVADRRMDAIKDLRVGHADMGKSGDEDMKRYSFDVYRGEEEWVDKGPEFGYGRRGVERMRGGAPLRGGYRGGGGARGGYRDRDRDDVWRGPRR